MKTFTPRQRAAIRESVNARCAGSIDGSIARDHYDTAEAALNGRETILIAMTLKEALLLSRGLRAGIMDDGIECIGLTKHEQLVLGDVGNGIAAACGTEGRYYGRADRGKK